MVEPHPDEIAKPAKRLDEAVPGSLRDEPAGHHEAVGERLGSAPCWIRPGGIAGS